jgi:hypothetical protein
MKESPHCPNDRGVDPGGDLAGATTAATLPMNPKAKTALATGVRLARQDFLKRYG